MENLTKKQQLMIDLYRTMLRIRLCEESLVDPILSGNIKCPVHLYSGQEAVAAGVCAALEQTDYIFGNHRSHGHFIAKGGRIDEMIAEIYGKSSGCSRGRGGSMHLIDVECGMMGAAPIVAGTISLAVGAALSSVIRKDGRVSVAFFGDGASNEGALFESMNFAALKKLPIIFLCENNLYSTHMPVRECRPDKPIHQMAQALGMAAKSIDGNDVMTVFSMATEVVDYCRQRNGPVFLECMTYRLRGHVGPDDNIQGCHTDIRPDEEVKRWREKDPLNKLEANLLEADILAQEDLNIMKRDVEKEINSAHQFAINCAYPDESEVADYVFK